MSNNRQTIEDALQRTVESHGGVEAMFTRHPTYRRGLEPARFAAQRQNMPLETKVGAVACITGPMRCGDSGIICLAYETLCTGGSLAESRENYSQAIDCLNSKTPPNHDGCDGPTIH